MDAELKAWQEWVNSEAGDRALKDRCLKTAFYAGRDSVKVNAELLVACKGLLARIRDDQETAMRLVSIVSNGQTHAAIDAARAAIPKATA